MTCGSRRTDLTPLLTSLTILAAVVGSLVAVPPAEAEVRPPAVDIVGQTPYVPADGVLTLTLDVAVDPAPAPAAGEALQVQVDAPPYEVAVTVFGLAEDEDDAERSPSLPLNRLDPVALADLPRDEGGRYLLDMAVRPGPPFDDRERVLLPDAGVYPVTVELRTEDEPVATTRTNLIRLPADGEGEGEGGDSAAGTEAAGTEAAGTATRPTGPPVAVVVPVSIADGLTATDAVEVLAAHPDVPVTVLLQPGVVDQLRSDAALARSLVEALGGRPVLAASEADLDPSALAAIDQTALFRDTALATRNDLTRLGFVVDERSTVLASPLTASGVAALGELDIEHVIGRGGTAAGTAGGSGVLRAGGSEVRVLAVDDGLGAGLTDRHPVEGANRILARLAIRGAVEPVPVILGGDLSGVQPTSVDALLGALDHPSAPEAVLLADAADVARLPLRPAELPEQDLVPIADLLVGVQAKLGTYESFFAGGGTEPDDYRDQVLSTLARSRNPDDRRRALTQLDARLGDDLAVIDLPDGQPVTLAARSAPIPLIVESSAGGPRSVLLRFRSDKVMAVDDGQVIVVEPGTSSIDVELEALSLGVSPLEVSVWTPDGGIELAATRFEVRSTAVPGLGSLAGLGAVGFLAVWWGIDARRRRERKEGHPVER